jgi:hypothetical protein
VHETLVAVAIHIHPHSLPYYSTLHMTYAFHALSKQLSSPLIFLILAAYSTLLTQLTYCGVRNRIGLEFHGLLSVMFCDAVLQGVRKESWDAGAKWLAKVGDVMTGGKPRCLYSFPNASSCLL